MSDRLHFAYYGIHNVTTRYSWKHLPKAMATQLNNNKALPLPANWFEAFHLLATLLNKKRSKNG
jgi:hypothetical protein